MSSSTPQQQGSHGGAQVTSQSGSCSDTGSVMYHTQMAAKEAGDTAHHLIQACTKACTHGSSMIKDPAGNLIHECNKVCRHTAECAKAMLPESLSKTTSKMMPSKAVNWIQRNPGKTTLLLFTTAMMMGLLFGTMGLGGALAGKGLFSSFRYETFSYPRGSPESRAHHMLDQALRSRHQSYLSKLMPSSTQDLTHYLTQLAGGGGGGGKQSEYSSNDMAKLISQAMSKSGSQSDSYMSDKLSSLLGAGGMMTGDQYDQDSSYWSSPVKTTAKKGMMSWFKSGLSSLWGGKSKGEMASSDRDELKRLLRQAARKADREL